MGAVLRSEPQAVAPGGAAPPLPRFFPYGRFLASMPANVLAALVPALSAPRLLPLARLYLRLFGFPDLGGQMRFGQVIARLQPQPGERLLDAGCGVGIFSLNLACAQRVHVSAVDLNADRIGRLQQLERSLPCPVSFHLMSVAELDFAAESFDRLICVEVLEHVPDDGAAARELARVARPGARLVLSVPTADRPVTGTEQEHLDHPADLAHVRVGYTADELRALLTGAGWTVRAIDPVFTYWENRLYQAQRWAYEQHHPLLNLLSFPVLRAGIVMLRRLPPRGWRRGWMVVADRR